MTFEQMQNQSIEVYRSNIEYLKTKHQKLYKKLELFEMGLNEGLIKAKYDLEYKEEGYFDALNLETNEYLYNQNSEVYARELVKNKLNNFPDKNSFRAFYGIEYSENVMKDVQRANAHSDAIILNAPVIHYVNTNIPEKEEMKVIPKMIVLGVGLGTHIPHIQMQTKPKIYLIVEPNLELFRLSLFVVKYYKLGELSNLVFSVGDNDQEFNDAFSSFYNPGFIYNHYFKHFIFSNTCESYISMIQTRLVTQNHLTYDYSRLIQSLTRTVDYIEQDYRILKIIPGKDKIYENKPVLFLGAGPSLQKNLDFVKENQDKYIIVAVYVLLPFLEEHNIKPDIVTQYDQAGDIVLNTVKKVQDINFFDKTLFLFASHLDKRVLESFPKENIFMFQSMYDVKIGFGAQTAPSIGEITYALLLKLGVKSIYMLGIDMALDPETNKSHIDGHTHSRNDFREEKKSNFSLIKDIIKVKGNFRKEVNTLPTYKSAINAFNYLSRTLLNEDTKVYNLSDGAYLEKIEPLKISEIQYSYSKLDKDAIRDNTYNIFLEKSEIGFNDVDKKLIELKIDDAKIIEDKIKNFFRTKESNLEVYENRLGILINDISFSKFKSLELQNIMLNYIMHNIHYVYHLINMKALTNPKKHLKNINKILQKQMLQITDVYIQTLSRALKEKEEDK